jgi:hypothetical protein
MTNNWEMDMQVITVLGLSIATDQINDFGGKLSKNANLFNKYLMVY